MRQLIKRKFFKPFNSIFYEFDLMNLGKSFMLGHSIILEVLREDYIIYGDYYDVDVFEKVSYCEEDRFFPS